jgi:beta-N-acetylhexosaminidase
MQAAAAKYGIAGASVRALSAGVDAICVGGDNADETTAMRLWDAVVAAVASGKLPLERLEEAASRVAALAAWSATQTARRTARLASDGALGIAAARRALRVTAQHGATLLPLAVAPHVVEVAPARNIAVGDGVPWGLADLIATAMPGTTSDRLTESDLANGFDPAALLDRAGTRPVVLVVSDAHRHGRLSALIKTIEAVRDDCIVVELGIPAQTSGAVHVATHGGSLACRRAAAGLLTGERVG